jgi:hypothetical protein
VKRGQRTGTGTVVQNNVKKIWSDLYCEVQGRKKKRLESDSCGKLVDVEDLTVEIDKRTQ